MATDVEYYGSDEAPNDGDANLFGAIPSAEFGPSPTDAVTYGREYIVDGPGGTDGGDFRSDSGDDFERGDDGTVKRNKDGSARRKRGRKRGSERGSSSPRKSSRSNVLSESFFAKATMTGLNMVSAMASAPEWGIEEDEAQQWGKAIADLAALYDFKPTAEQEAWMQLILVIGVGVGSRAYLTAQRLKSENARNVSRGAKTPVPAKAAPAPSTPGPMASQTPSVTAGGAFPEFKPDG